MRGARTLKGELPVVEDDFCGALEDSSRGHETIHDAGIFEPFKQELGIALLETAAHKLTSLLLRLQQCSVADDSTEPMEQQKTLQQVMRGPLHSLR
jgi:hypothetical protein